MTRVNTIRCGICDIDIFKMYRGTLSEKQLEVKSEQIPDQVLYTGKTRKICTDCYKTLDAGLKIYQEKNPEWSTPKLGQKSL